MTSPFHAGERVVQDHIGTRDLADRVGRMITRFVPPEHRTFFGELPVVWVGGRGPDGAVWATVRTGEPGFVSTSDPVTVRVDAPALAGDPLPIEVGSAVGLLGLQSETRRRNRVNGRVIAADPRGFELHVEQSFGNCPKYIRSRAPSVRPQGPVEVRPVRERLTAEAEALVRAADTLFLATASGGENGGADASHRGGRPGFVRIDHDRDGTLLTIPDFSGNFLFNTLGNVAADPRAGLLVPDYRTGDGLHLTGEATIVWGGPEVRSFAGAERLVRFRVQRGVYRTGILPFRWTDGEPGPRLGSTGTW